MKSDVRGGYLVSMNHSKWGTSVFTGHVTLTSYIDYSLYFKKFTNPLGYTHIIFDPEECSVLASTCECVCGY